jgi:hypothetical protein
MDMIANVMQFELPHWLIVTGFAFVLFGFVGILLRRPRDALQPPAHDA